MFSREDLENMRAKEDWRRAASEWGVKQKEYKSKAQCIKLTVEKQEAVMKRTIRTEEELKSVRYKDCVKVAQSWRLTSRDHRNNDKTCTALILAARKSNREMLESIPAGSASSFSASSPAAP